MLSTSFTCTAYFYGILKQYKREPDSLISPSLMHYLNYTKQNRLHKCNTESANTNDIIATIQASIPNAEHVLACVVTFIFFTFCKCKPLGGKKNPWQLYGSVKVDFVCLLVLQWSFSCWALDWRGPQYPAMMCVCCFPTRTCWSWSSPAVGQRVDRGFTSRVTRNVIPSQIAPHLPTSPHPPHTHSLPVWLQIQHLNRVLCWTCVCPITRETDGKSPLNKKPGSEKIGCIFTQGAHVHIGSVMINCHYID